MVPTRRAQRGKEGWEGGRPFPFLERFSSPSPLFSTSRASGFWDWVAL